MQELRFISIKLKESGQKLVGERAKKGLDQALGQNITSVGPKR